MRKEKSFSVVFNRDKIETSSVLCVANIAQCTNGKIIPANLEKLSIISGISTQVGVLSLKPCELNPERPIQISTQVEILLCESALRWD